MGGQDKEEDPLRGAVRIDGPGRGATIRTSATKKCKQEEDASASSTKKKARKPKSLQKRPTETETEVLVEPPPKKVAKATKRCQKNEQVLENVPTGGTVVNNYPHNEKLSSVIRQQSSASGF